jgi:hypothetical protein
MPSEGGTSFLVRGVLRRHLWARYRHFREREERMYRIWYWAMISRENDGRFVASIPDLGGLAAYGDTDKDAVAHVTDLAASRPAVGQRIAEAGDARSLHRDRSAVREDLAARFA